MGEVWLAVDTIGLSNAQNPPKFSQRRIPCDLSPGTVFFFLLTVMLAIPLIWLAGAQPVSAQSYWASSDHKSSQIRTGRRVRQVRRARPVRRMRQQIVRKPAVGFFDALFGNKQKRRQPARGLKPLFGSSGLNRNASAVDLLMNNQIISNQFRTPRRSRRLIDPYGLPLTAGGGFGNGRYRTMCVRMCDGYYFPISFKTRARHFKADAARCSNACGGAEAKLFYYSNPGDDVDNMRSLDGQRYSEIANAFKYRKVFAADCRCRPAPWSKEARARHKSYARGENPLKNETKTSEMKPKIEKSTLKMDLEIEETAHMLDHFSSVQ